MATIEHVELIQRGAAEWNRWRSVNTTVRPDLGGAKLRGAQLDLADLSNADLMEADLRGASLIDAHLRGVNLSKADLSEANLGRANLIDADLHGANLGEAHLRGTYFDDADLCEAQLFEADLSGTKLRRANLRGACLFATNLDLADLREADLSDADLRGANLRWADLRETDLSRVLFEETILGSSNLTGAKGLGPVVHRGPSTLDHRTLARSGQLPLSFLRGCGLPDTLIQYLPSLINRPMEFYSCFISYNHTDKAFARLLHDTLQGCGIRCWLDEKQLLPGDNIYEHVDRGIRLWDKVLLCCSKQSLTSWWVDNEIGKAFAKEQALMKERKEKVHVLIPLNLDGYLLSGDWPSGKASQVLERLAGDFQGWELSHSQFEKQVEPVIRALRADENARDQPPKPRL